MAEVKVYIKRRREILDPQGKAIEQGIKLLGFNNVSNVRLDKFIEFEIDENDPEKIKTITTKICNDLLANSHLEDYSFEITKI
ncbi:MAG: phosphoribosylformylglycinamidine synthase subunit PurS [Ignavibacteria bacterium]|nr:phosphoribosylformylglycinamidine synthase subunit PurS [Ignavibacteria bacterium]